jgi:hypothetical protein
MVRYPKFLLRVVIMAKACHTALRHVDNSECQRYLMLRHTRGRFPFTELRCSRRRADDACPDVGRPRSP